MKLYRGLNIAFVVAVVAWIGLFPKAIFQMEKFKDAPADQNLFNTETKPREILVRIKQESSKEETSPAIQGRKVEDDDPFDVQSFIKYIKEKEKLSDSEFEKAVIEAKLILPSQVLMEIGTTPSLARAAISPDQIFSEEDVLTEEELSSPRSSPLYRGDSRSFSVVFADGFQPRLLARMALQEQIAHAYIKNGEETRWISTAENFPTAARYTGRAGYVYEIYKPGGIPVRSILKFQYKSDGHIQGLINHDTIWEVLFSRPIEPRFIKGAWEVKGKQPGKFYPNPNFRPD